VHAANHPTSRGKIHTCGGRWFQPQGAIILQSNIGALLLRMFRDQFRHNVCWDSFQFMRLEVEKGWQKASIWKTGIRISKLIKEWVNKCLNSSASQIGGVLEQPGYQINSFRWHSFVKYLVPWVCFDLWEFELRVIRVHAFNFFPCRGTKDLDDFNKLIHTTFTRKQRL